MKEHLSEIIQVLKDRYGTAPCALHYEKDYELMIAVRLSAQCTDARVNLVTPALFAAYPTLEAMAGADISRVEEFVHSCGFISIRPEISSLAVRCFSGNTAEKSPEPWRSC